jgi:hypothetical protein
MRYTLRITDHNYNVVLELHYDYYSTVRETAAQMVRGATQDRSMDILIINNETQREIWSDATRVV